MMFFVRRKRRTPTNTGSLPHSHNKKDPQRRALPTCAIFYRPLVRGCSREVDDRSPLRTMVGRGSTADREPGVLRPRSSREIVDRRARTPLQKVLSRWRADEEERLRSATGGFDDDDDDNGLVVVVRVLALVRRPRTDRVETGQRKREVDPFARVFRSSSRPSEHGGLRARGGHSLRELVRALVRSFVRSHARSLVLRSCVSRSSELVS